ncbi:MAG: hypothetical protein JXA67_10775 [Micromonosporaceae bacterium]|nr:hypothetical protein [Micromonosporaceae bacterium]
MPRKPAGRKSTRRTSRYTPEEIAAWRQRDRDVMNRSTEYLEDGPSVRRFARNATDGQVSARILGYSLRNQMLLERQAEEHGFRLTDVDTLRGWRDRGRKVRRGETGLRLIRPVGKDTKDADPDASPTEEPERDEDAEDRDDSTEDEPKVKFRTGVVFDIAQTDATEPEDTDACPQCTAEAGEPCHPGCICPACLGVDDQAAAETLWNNLYEQITKAGYAIDWPATAANLAGQRVRVDHDAHTVYAELGATADDPDAVGEFAAALAEIVTRADRAAETRRAERKALRALTAAPATV